MSYGVGCLMAFGHLALMMELKNGIYHISYTCLSLLPFMVCIDGPESGFLVNNPGFSIKSESTILRYILPGSSRSHSTL